MSDSNYYQKLNDTKISSSEAVSVSEEEIKEAAREYAESCDNESGSFLSHQLIAIREKAWKACAEWMLAKTNAPQGEHVAPVEVSELIKILQFYAGNWDGREGSYWIKDMLVYEDKFGMTHSDQGQWAQETLAKLGVKDER